MLLDSPLVRIKSRLPCFGLGWLHDLPSRDAPTDQAQTWCIRCLAPWLLLRLDAAAALLVPLPIDLAEANTSYLDHKVKASPDLYDFTTETIALCGVLLQALSSLHWSVIMAGFGQSPSQVMASFWHQASLITL